MRNTTIYVSIGAAMVFGALMYISLHHAGAGQEAAVAGAPAASTTPTAITINPSGVHVDPTVLDAPTTLPADSVEYCNQKYHFCFSHAPGAEVKEYDEGGGAETVVLENLNDPNRARGMQVFIVPYQGTTISDARFHEDEPSGVRTNVANTTIDGVRAVTFNSYDSFLGDTLEVWFIRGGYLYEVTTFADVARWFTPIMQSWKFLIATSTTP